MEEQLIEFIRNNPFLYNKKHKNYKNSWLREQKYSEMSSPVNIPPKKLKDRWRTLKDKFYKECKKEPSGAGFESPRKWKWWDHLTFLKDVEAENPNTSGNFEILAEEIFQNTSQELQLQSFSNEENGLDISPVPIESPQSASANKHKKRTRVDEMLMVANADFSEMAQLATEVLNEPNSKKTSVQIFCDGLAHQIEDSNLTQLQFSGLQITLLQTFQEFLQQNKSTKI